VLQSDGKPFRGVTPVVFLHHALTPFIVNTSPGRDGRFKFKNLLPGMYTMVIDVPRRGEVARTVEVTESFADDMGRIFTEVLFEKYEPARERQVVSTVALSIPEKARREFEKAQQRLARNDVKGAVGHLKKAVEISPQFAAALNHLGTIAYQSRQYALAEEYFRDALAQDPEAYDPLVNLGGALLSQQKYKESLPVNLDAVSVKPDDPLAHSQLGQSYYRLGQIEKAERHLKQAKALDPGHFSLPQLYLMEIYGKKGNAAAAIAEAEEFLRLHPDSALAPRLRGLLESARRLPPKEPQVPR